MALRGHRFLREESPKGSPQRRSSAFVGKGGARERAQFSPKAETELSGLCDDAKKAQGIGASRIPPPTKVKGKVKGSGG